jgi:murein DD-endopeptidase MepM/ murein hydrolase activator NlpD
MFGVRRLILALLLLTSLTLPLRVAAQGPDYDAPGQWALPWECGQGYRITWEPEGHWASGKAHGLAYDLATPTGTPLLAPFSGHAYFLYDERPFDTNFGHYVELVSADGQWLLRLAHLRDALSGERPVKVGDLLGHAGSSGVRAAHLHMELLVREGDGWGRPDWGRLPLYFGHERGALIEGAILTHGGCKPNLELRGAPRLIEDRLVLGQRAMLRVPLHNAGQGETTLHTVQVALRHSSGVALVADAAGEWFLGAQEGVEIIVPIMPDQAGTWDVTSVTYATTDAAVQLPAELALAVEPLPLRVLELAGPGAVLNVGDPISFTLTIENYGEKDIPVDDLGLHGVRPDAVNWQVSWGTAGTLRARGVTRLEMHSVTVPRTVGLWQATHLTLTQDGLPLTIAPVTLEFAVLGPEFEVQRVELFASGQHLHVFATLRNIGTRGARPDVFEVWGWQPDGETSYSLEHQPRSAIAPGQTTLVHLTAPMDITSAGEWRLAGAGVWLKGAYYVAPLPPQPGVALPAFAHQDLQAP